MPEKFCPHCGESIPEGSKYCPKCGASVDVEVTPVSTPDSTHPVNEGSSSSSSDGHTFGILAIILGLCSSGLLGIILGIIGLGKSTTAEDKKLNYIGIFLPLGFWLIAWIIIIIMALVVGGAAASAAVSGVIALL